jgi:hypothetical protein
MNFSSKLKGAEDSLEVLNLLSRANFLQMILHSEDTVSVPVVKSKAFLLLHRSLSYVKF